MARTSDQQHAYPLFFEPYMAPRDDESQRDNIPAGTVHGVEGGRSVSPGNASCGILDRLRTIKLDTPALRRTQVSDASGHRPRKSSLNALASKGEPSAFAVTSRALQEPSAFASTLTFRRDRSDNHGRHESLQQRRQHARGVHGSMHSSLSISSPTARQASISRARVSRPAGPMIWLPDEQVWLLADPDAVDGMAAAAPPGVTYPHSAPLDAYAPDRARSTSPRRDQGESEGNNGENAPEGHRLTRSDSSPIRSQFLSLIRPQGPRMSSFGGGGGGSSTYGFAAQDWTIGGVNAGPSALEEDALWYAEQQARLSQRRDQDRFSPMLQQALTGVDIPLSGSFGHRMGGAGDSPGGSIRRASTVAGPSGTAAARLRRKRSGSLRSRVSTIGNEDDAAAAASMYLRDVREQVPKRRRSDGQVETPDGSGGNTTQPGHRIVGWPEGQETEEEWLASLVAQGINPEGIFTPRESVVSVSSTTAPFHQGFDLDNLAGLPPFQVGPVPEDRLQERKRREQEGGAAAATARSKVMKDFERKRVSEWVDDTATPSPTSVYPEDDKTELGRRLAELRSEALETISPLAPAATLLGSNGSVAAREGRLVGRRRFPSVSTVQGGEGRDSVDFRDGEVSPVSSRG